MRSFFCTALLAAAVGFACSGNNATPTTPSALTPATPTATSRGAAITGYVTAASASAATSGSIRSLTGASPVITSLPSMTVSVVGTSVSGPVSPAGAFALDGVPEGVVRLRFAGSGIDATVSLDPVAAADTVSVLIGLSPTAAIVEAESRNAGGTVEFEGRIESLPPTQPADTLVVGGRTVTVSTQTQIRDGSATLTLAALVVGQRVHVKGRLDGASIAAAAIELQNTNAWVSVVINGVVESVSGTASTFTLFVGGREIRGDVATTFFGSGDTPLTFAALVAGAAVNVKGQQRDAYVYAERIHVTSATTPTEPQDTSASIEGRLNAMSGTAPTLTLTIGTTTVTTTASTEVQRGGDVQPLSALAIGQTIHAVGTRLSDASIVARKLQIKADETGGAFQIAGAVGGLKGTCPTLTFGVNGYSIVTTASTTFGPGTNACVAIKSGSKVQVEGTKQADGTVKADKVTAQ